MFLESLMAWVFVVAAAVVLWVGLPIEWFMLCLILASIFYTRYDLKEEIKRVMGVEDEVRTALKIRERKVDLAVKKRENLVDSNDNKP